MLHPLALLIGGSLLLGATSQRNVLMWLVPYPNLTSVAEYVSAWSQLPNNPAYFYAGSAYALKDNASLGYATTPAGEAYDGIGMEFYGFPALHHLGINSSRILGMVYVTHSAAIAKMLRDPGTFIDELVAKADEQNLGGFDIDYEPQQVAGDGATFMNFITTLAGRLAAQGRVLTVDISGCPTSFGFDCAGLASPSNIPGLMQVGNGHAPIFLLWIPTFMGTFYVQVNCEDSFGVGSVADIKVRRVLLDTLFEHNPVFELHVQEWGRMCASAAGSLLIALL